MKKKLFFLFCLFFGRFTTCLNFLDDDDLLSCSVLMNVNVLECVMYHFIGSFLLYLLLNYYELNLMWVVHKLCHV